MSEIKFTAQEQAEVETLTLTKKIARGMKGCAHGQAAGRVAEHQSKNGVQAGEGRTHSLRFALGLPYASMPDSSSTGCGNRGAEGMLGNHTKVP